MLHLLKRQEILSPQAIDNARSFFHKSTHQAYDKSAELGQHIIQSYPGFMHKARSLAHDATAESKSALSLVGDHFNSAVHMVGNQVRSTERKFLKVGFLYAFYKLFLVKDENFTNAATRLRSHVKENPLQSAFIAVGTGYLLGRIFK